MSLCLICGFSQWGGLLYIYGEARERAGPDVDASEIEVTQGGHNGIKRSIIQDRSECSISVHLACRRANHSQERFHPHISQSVF